MVFVEVDRYLAVVVVDGHGVQAAVEVVAVKAASQVPLDGIERNST